MLWQKDADVRPPLSWVTQTRRGRGYVRSPDNSLAFVIDFVGPALKKLPPEGKVEGIVSVHANAELVQQSAYRNQVTGGWRLVLRVRRLDDSKPVELRAFLRNGTNIVSETWSYIIPPS
jgi:glucans biosynthesis protein